MHPIVTLLAGLSSPGTMKEPPITTAFWQDSTRIQSLADPPPANYLSKIQQEPWRGGLEPIPVGGIPQHEAVVVLGKIPSDLQGVLCRNGPGRIRIGNSQYGHWFDGDGVVSKLTIDGSKQSASFVAKYVETDRFQKQRQISQTEGDVPFATAGAWTKKGRGRFIENLFAIPTNPANTNVLFVEGKEDPSKPRLFALAEGGSPMELDPSTLDTMGSVELESASGEKASTFFSAHYKKDPLTGDIFNHGTVMGAKCGVNLMKLSSTGDLLLQSRYDDLFPGATFVHDNMLSEKYMILLSQPYGAPPLSLLTSVAGGAPLGQQLRWTPETLDGATNALVFSKDTLECVAKIPLPIFSTYHQIDAFDDPSNPNLVTFRVLAHDPPNSREQLEDGFKDLYSHENLPLCQILQFTIDISGQKVVNSQRVAPKANLCELPDTNTDWQSHQKRYVWTNTRTENSTWLNSLQKVDMETGSCSNVISFGDTSFAGNPIFVPKQSAKTEDDGYIISQIYRSDEHRSDVAILDASTMRQLALLRLKCHITYQFHGEWCFGLV